MDVRLAFADDVNAILISTLVPVLCGSCLRTSDDLSCLAEGLLNLLTIAHRLISLITVDSDFTLQKPELLQRTLDRNNAAFISTHVITKDRK